MTEAEVEVEAMLTAEGWTVLRSGWPDFLCVRLSDDRERFEVKAVEAKTGADPIRPDQARMISALEFAGIETEIIRKNGTPARQRIDRDCGRFAMDRLLEEVET